MKQTLPQAKDRTCSSHDLQYWACITPRQLGYMNESRIAPWHLGGYGTAGRYSERECFAVIFIADCRRKGMFFREIKRHLAWLISKRESAAALPDYLVVTANATSRITSDVRMLYGIGAEVIQFLVSSGKPGYVVDLADIQARVASAMSGAPRRERRNAKTAAGSVSPHGGIGL